MAALLTPLLTCLVLSAFRDHVSQGNAVLVLVLLVVAAAASGDRFAGLLAALSSAASFEFFLTEPYDTFKVDKSEDLVLTVLLLLIGAAVTEVALWGRRQQQRAGERAGYLTGVLRVGDAVALHDQEPDALRTCVAEQIKELLGVAACRFAPGPGHDPRNAVLQRDGTVIRNGHLCDVDRDGLPTDEETVLPVLDDSGTIGNFVLNAASTITRPTLEQRQVAVLLAEQVGRLGVAGGHRAPG